MKKSLREYRRLFLTDISFRAEASLYASFALNAAYAVIKLAAGIYYASFWYGADALYYIALSAARFYLLRFVRIDGRGLDEEYRQYRLCGYFLLLMNIALIGVVYQIVNQGMGYRYPGLLIYAAATYAFYCVIVSIINVAKYRKLNSPALSAAKMVSLTKALVAMFALQGAMIASFGSGDTEAFKNTINSITGSCVCFVIFCMAVYMIVRAGRNLKRLI
jgi:divalent metal cation (Fe/Co/Zn/Cd) transporter